MKNDEKLGPNSDFQDQDPRPILPSSPLSLARVSPRGPSCRARGGLCLAGPSEGADSSAGSSGASEPLDVIPMSRSCGHEIFVSGSLLACRRCGSCCEGGSQSQLFEPCQPELPERNPSRRYKRDRVFDRSLRPKVPGRTIATARAFKFSDDVAVWLGLA